MDFRELSYEKRRVRYYIPESYQYNTDKRKIIFFHDGDGVIDIIHNKTDREVREKLKECILIFIESENRLDDYSPWKAPSLNPRFPAFSGGGAAYIRWMEQTLVPELSKEINFSLSRGRIISTGFSLGALVTLYGMYVSGFYDKYILISLSAWYPELIPFLEKNRIKNERAQILFLSGKNEGANKNNIQRQTPELAEKCCSLLKQQTAPGSCEILWDGFDHNEGKQYRYNLYFDQFL